MRCRNGFVLRSAPQEEESQARDAVLAEDMGLRVFKKYGRHSIQGRIFAWKCLRHGALRANASRAGQIECRRLRGFAWAQPRRVFSALSMGPRLRRDDAAALRSGVSASVRSYGPRLHYGKARWQSGGSAMALFAGLSVGGKPGGRRRDRAARAGGTFGERRQKVNVWRGPQAPGTAGLTGHPLSNMAYKPLRSL